MKRSVPQLISLVAIVAGLVLFLVTMLGIDRTETMSEVRRLGVALPLVLLPSIGWHLLRAAGWYVCFPPESRPSYWRVWMALKTGTHRPSGMQRLIAVSRPLRPGRLPSNRGTT